MAARNRSTIGMRHPTVVPTNFDENAGRGDADRAGADRDDADRIEDRDDA